MGRKVDVSAQDIKDRAGKEFPPLPAGKTLFNIYSVKESKYENGAQKGLPRLEIQFQVAAGQPRANARLFENFLDQPRWNPKPPKTEGSLNFHYHPFYEALGVEFPKDGGEVELPEIEDIVGEQIVIDLKIEPDVYKFRKAYTEWEEAKEKAEAEGKLEKFLKKNEEPVQESFKRNGIKTYLSAEDFDPEDAEVASKADDEFDL